MEASNRVSLDGPIACPICWHDYGRDEMTRHHLVPKSRKGREIVLLCRPCHKQIHAVFSEKQLERDYGSLERLLAAAQMQSWIRWIRKRKPTSKVVTRRSNNHPKRR
jgi:hypothetical protein